MYRRLGLDRHKARVISVAGTNGKGTCVEAIQALSLASGYRVGCYTSPHLWRYNERIRVNGVAVDDATIVAAFERIEAARDGESLTYFEFGTLAALEIFARNELDLWVLEVGLGGRLDAVNMVDANVAVVTSIGLDHAEWLGTDLNQIAREKLAIGRAGKPLLTGPGVPQAACEQAMEQGIDVRRLNTRRLADDACPAGLVRDNLELACGALQSLNMLDAEPAHVLSRLRVPGRCERHIEDAHEVIYDVAHNLDAIEHLAAYLRTLPQQAPVFAVFSALSEKPIEQMSAMLDPLLDGWCLFGLDDPRGLAVADLQARVVSTKPSYACQSFDQAMDKARSLGRRIVVCGSFLTVSAGSIRHG